MGGRLVCQPKHLPQLCSTGPNPAQPILEARMGTLPSFTRSEILGHENALKYLSSQGVKGELRDQHGWLLSGSFWREIAFTRVDHLLHFSRLTPHFWAATPFKSAVLMSNLVYESLL